MIHFTWKRRRQRSSEYLFPGFGKKRPFITDARATMDAVSKVAGCHCSMHSLRRTYEDCLRYAKVDPDERRLLLNHIGGDVHQSATQTRTTLRRCARRYRQQRTGSSLKCASQ
jgi:integrase